MCAFVSRKILGVLVGTWS